MLAKLAQCGPENKPCIQVDEHAGGFGNQSDYRLILGYWTPAWYCASSPTFASQPSGSVGLASVSMPSGRLWRITSAHQANMAAIAELEGGLRYAFHRPSPESRCGHSCRSCSSARRDRYPNGDWTLMMASYVRRTYRTVSINMPSQHPSILLPSIEEKLWQSMRHDFVSIAPDYATSEVLPCCACGRLLSKRHFTLEHIIPQQALADDPIEVRHVATLNQRSRNLLLCNSRLKVGHEEISKLGCNAWKGKYYDSQIRDVISGKGSRRYQGGLTSQHQVAVLIAGYLALVSEYGYRVVFTASGRLLRQQFFHPHNFIDGIPAKCQAILTGECFTFPKIPIEVWTRPFSFTIDGEFCIVAMRQTGMFIPLSRDPRLAVPFLLKIMPKRFGLRPDFQTIFS